MNPREFGSDDRGEIRPQNRMPVEIFGLWSVRGEAVRGHLVALGEYEIVLIGRPVICPGAPNLFVGRLPAVKLDHEFRRGETLKHRIVDFLREGTCLRFAVFPRIGERLGLRLQFVLPRLLRLIETAEPPGQCHRCDGRQGRTDDQETDFAYGKAGEPPHCWRLRMFAGGVRARHEAIRAIASAAAARTFLACGPLCFFGFH